MTGFAQTLHVMRKDIREMWPAALAYLAALAVAATTARLGVGGDSYGLVMPIVVIGGGAMVLAQAVQSDTPSRMDAFWATRPIPTSAILGAKLCLGVVLIALALGVQGAVASTFHLSLARAERFVSISGSTYAVCLLVAAITAAVTADVAAFAVVAVGLGVFVALVAPFTFFFPASAIHPMPYVTAAAALVAVCLFGLLYRVRDNRRLRVAAVASVVVCAGGVPSAASSMASSVRGPDLSGPMLPLWLGVPEPSDVATRDMSDRLTFTVHLRSRDDTLHALAATRFRDPALDTVRLRLIAPRIVVQLRDGSTFSVPTDEQVVDLSSPSPLVDDVDWIRTVVDEPVGHDPMPGSDPTRSLNVSVTDRQRDAMAGGVAGIALEGRVTVLAPRLVAVVSPARDAPIVADGWRVRPAAWAQHDDAATLAVEATSIASPSRGSLSPSALDDLDGVEGQALQLALVSRQPCDTAYSTCLTGVREEGMVLTGNGTTEVPGWLVLPGWSAWTTHLTVEVDPPYAGIPDLKPSNSNRDWLASARLMVVEWTARGSYPIHVAAEIKTTRVSGLAPGR